MNELPERKINLINIIEEVFILLQHNLSKKKINLKKNIFDNKIEIKGDENRLKQLFINLINNGIEAVLDYGTIKIDMSKDTNNDFVEISITDNGHGIPDDIKNNIFNPFFTTKLNKINTGLGLSICQHIIEEHNGVISFSSIPGKKTKFIVRFPLESSNK
jgi:signal transduction histidine kinase